MKYFTIILLFLSVFNLNAQKNTVYVSPDGNDKNEGTEHLPVATIEIAQQLVKKIKRNNELKDTVFVFLRKGVYRLKQGILFNSEDAGTKNSPVVYKAFEGEKVTISGSVAINNYKPLSKDHSLYLKNPDIGNKIIEIDLQETGLNSFNKLRLSGFGGQEAQRSYALRELYFNKKPMQLSRWPNNGFSNFTSVVTDKLDSIELTGIVYENEHISTWKNEPNILLHGYWYYLWADAYEQVSKIDTANQVIWLNPPYNHYTFRGNHPFAAYNVIAEIDQPDEWAYDYQNKKIYFYPPDDVKNASLELSICEEPLLTISGTQWITFKDICFEMGSSEGLRISNSNFINIDNCKIHAFARDGIILNGGNNNTISSCEIYNLGRGAIKISAGNRETLKKSGFIIDNCHIHNLSRIDRTYTPGIWVDGVGTTITHCKIHDIPSSAMRINGNDHMVEYNEMHHVVTESDDQGAIDMWGDPSFRGNVFRYNYIHDIGPYATDKIKSHAGRAGIRFDDAISGNWIYANIFKNCAGGNFGAIQIHGGKENLIQNNLFYQCSAAISFTPWNRKFWLKYTEMSVGFIERNKELYEARYPKMKKLNSNMNKNTVIQNVFMQCENISLRKPKVVIFEHNIEINGKQELTDIREVVNSLKNISGDLKKFKYEPIPFEKIGLIK
ncbi:MAG: hypothetical protein DRJ10_01705 [Bacteroidetes bacterium]|nr:MAG: hypothetical protein DRJ10_01705 [Bacteroidota bacterium]